MHRNGLLPVASPAPPWIGTSVPASVRRIKRRLIAAVGGLGTVADQIRVRKYPFGNPDTNKGEKKRWRKGGRSRGGRIKKGLEFGSVRGGVQAFSLRKEKPSDARCALCV
ncbi:hypothetical protein GHT06_007528 [Daphnia sinensis]|uniref:Uncharacterized protein n=1 Tax=Daphnia sinensis TaxID=1820382 RepID=A0AAD5KDY7_9CRUS|nr:hypothetical protein GHT06_007528 [Daphnia sinensis]